jgi:hypothetical protein
MSLTKLGNNIFINLFPSRESLVSDIPSRDRKTANLFLQCSFYLLQGCALCILFAGLWVRGTRQPHLYSSPSSSRSSSSNKLPPRPISLSPPPSSPKRGNNDRGATLFNLYMNAIAVQYTPPLQYKWKSSNADSSSIIFWVLKADLYF